MNGPNAMSDTKSLIALGFAFYVLLALWSANPTIDKSSLFNISNSSVSELVFNFNVQRELARL